MAAPLRSRRVAAALAVAVTGGLLLDAGAALADPPPWAPAHGWRAKHEYKHKHKHKDRDWHDGPRVVYVPVPTVVERKPAPSLPYGFGRGTCDRGLISSELLGNLLGGAAGGAIGSRFGQGQGKLAAVAGGTLLGVLIGGSIGRSMDAADQACAITALDYVPDDRRIRWSGDRADYALVPTRSYERGGRYCREYTTTAYIGNRPDVVSGTACRMPDGAWEIVN
ncbi:hypothetical protein [Caenispirillum bisanense]|uniref:Surface antigen n=1 Tax=Caenispirillum bisanense TaxID=414052 RepID=A0A286G273_9PROT|nr:hypothetical protein [Caenispirillum bisanense]SOD89346.1 Surface antigen [Caenispirillum bisanense]